jgi:predicted transcriptional regulator of viral defense system
LADAQNGLVTRQQAITELELTAAAVDNLVARGRLKRVAHGIYRYPYLPGVEDEALQVALLRTGDPHAALSHETALQLHDISDVNPTRYHVTIPDGRRIRRSDNDRYVVHVQRLTDAGRTWWHQMRIVTPAVAIAQCIVYGTPTYLLRQALSRGAGAGALRRTDARSLTALLEQRA